jgi:regulation of enolase protein 1 (concanavalin A-like superfamily)
MVKMEPAYRQQLQKILASREFSSAPQLRAFLSYVSEAALQNRTHLDQVEIAGQVLGKGEEFNPVDDASVRRIATLARQKIEKYYAESGRDDPVLVTLPVRSYVPVFHLRDAPTRPLPVRRLLYALAAVVALTAVLYLALPTRIRPAGTIDLFTARGSIENKSADLPGDRLLVGPRLWEDDDVSVRLEFSPDQVYQQAGLLIYQNPDQYVKLGRQFSGRAYLEFGIENQGVYPRPADNWTYDLHGQSGHPLRLMIRRRQEEFRAYTSLDGFSWRRIGATLRSREPMRETRLALYAANGQVEAAHIRARFLRPAIGLTFTDWSADEAAPRGWTTDSGCSEGSPAAVVDNALELRFPSRPCIWQFIRRAHSRDWTITTRLDLQPFSGVVAGLIVRGSKGRLRLVRWSLNGGSIAAEYPPGNQVTTLPDYPGWPPVVLRLEARNGVVRGSFSRDEVNFQNLDAAMRLDELGDNIEFGITSQLTSWSQTEAIPTPRFYYVQQEVSDFAGYR